MGVLVSDGCHSKLFLSPFNYPFIFVRNVPLAASIWCPNLTQSVGVDKVALIPIKAS
jgi:hypothetical protein